MNAGMEAIARRSFLIAAILAALIAAPVWSTSASADPRANCGNGQGKALLIGCANNLASDQTALTVTGNKSGLTGLYVQDSAAGSEGIFGGGTLTGVDGYGASGYGVIGSSQSGVGVYGEGAVGVEGFLGSTDTGSAAVEAISENGTTAVSAISDAGPPGNGSNAAVSANDESTGIAVWGQSNAGTGVQAQSSLYGTALNVVGTVRFSSAGTAVVPSGAKFVTVTPLAFRVTPSSLILALVQQKGGFFVTNAVAGDSVFTIYLNKAPTAPTTVTVAYLVIGN